MKSILFVLASLVCLMAWQPVSANVESTTANVSEGFPAILLDEEVKGWFASLPVLDSGRVKPLDTVARFRLLSYSGKQSLGVKGHVLLPGVEKLSAMEWLLLSWFKPEIAKELPLFIVDNSEAIVELGLTPKGIRDRYSVNEIAPAVETLIKKLQEIGPIEAKQRTPAQRYIYKLGADFFDYALITAHFEFARSPFGDSAAMVPQELLVDGKVPALSDLLPKLAVYIKDHPELLAPINGPQPWLEAFSRSLMGARMSRNQEQTLRIFPPSKQEGELWQSPGSIMQSVLETGSIIGVEQMAEFKLWETLPNSINDSSAFKETLKEFYDAIYAAIQPSAVGENLAEITVNAKHLDLEVKYHEKDYMTRSLIFFILGLLTLAISWSSVNSKFGKGLKWITWITLTLGAFYVTYGIIIRCIIMQRPPVTSLYETIIFITSTGVILCLIAEMMIPRKGLAILTAALCGVAGMYVSIRYMNMEGSDTMQQLQAVLITNFWLATHVPIINLGYAAGMVGAVMSMIYFIGNAIGKFKVEEGISRDLTRVTYGFIMAGLFLSLVGTILGGIWANYSWGRFWGWDPKENGALLIVLINLVILHARLGGYIREIGFHALSIVLGMTVVFSWFGTNQLGVGLHAYGFTDGIWFKLFMFWLSQCLFIVYAGFLYLHHRSKKLTR